VCAVIYELVSLLVSRSAPQKKEVFEDLVVGHSNRVIADKLSISPRTLEIHRTRVTRKMQAQSLPHLVRMALAIEAEFDGEWFHSLNESMRASI
jgi:FixJ family two-component response regulator